jgi:hypothetical protein
LESIEPIWRKPGELAITFLLLLVPYERLQFESRLCVDSAKRRVEVFLMSPRPIHLENRSFYMDFDVNGRLNDNHFELWSNPSTTATKVGPITFPSGEGDYTKYNHIPFVRGEIFPTPTGCSIRAVLHPSRSSLLGQIVFFLLAFLTTGNLHASFAICIFLYVFNWFGFKIESASAVSILKVLFRAR